MDLKEVLAQYIGWVDETLNRYMPKELSYAATIGEAMEYSLKAGGKRIRPIIMLKVCEGINSRTKKYSDSEQVFNAIAPLMAAIEMIHTYSLVHDDLPALDNDTLRRGKPSTWAKYGDGMALLTGDALLNYAYETAFKCLDNFDNQDNVKEEDSIAVIKSIRLLAQKAGIDGMIGGQVADVEAEKKHIKLDYDRLMYIHEKKTGALIQAAFMIGGIMGGADDEQIELLSQIGLDVGLAFQIQDDILDVIGDEKLLGKNVGSDVASGKETYVDLCGIERAKEEVASLSNRAIAGIESILEPSDREFIVELIKALIDRAY